MRQVVVSLGEMGQSAVPDGEREALRLALGRVAGGDAAALKEVYRRTSAKLFGVCLRILGETSEAEDVLQEVYVAVWRHSRTFDRERASPISWLAAIARNRAVDRLRARRDHLHHPIETAADIADEAPSALTEVLDAERRGRLHTCLGELEDVHRDAVRTAFLDGRTYEELARRSGVPVGTMKSWIRRSLLRLRTCLER